jgi:hypothetical protein
VSRKFIKSCKIINTLSVKKLELSRRLEMSSLSNYNTFNISPGKQAYLCSINDFWASRLKFLVRTNYLPLNESLKSLWSRTAAFERAVALKTRDPDKTMLLLFLFLRIVLVWYHVRFCIQIRNDANLRLYA